MYMSPNPGWKVVSASSLFQSSRYDPLDLFSGDLHRIRQAVQNLVTCPQNNLKVWLGDEALIGAPPARSSPKWELLGNDWWSRDDRYSPSATNVESFVVDMVASVLDGENLLSNLLPLQKLDIVDADGAILLYDRLVQLVGGSLDDAERLLETQPWHTSNYNNEILHPFSLNHCLSQWQTPP
jgi:inositol-pentakisphosphate 2-kinase